MLQSLPDHGVSLFVVRFHGEKKEELLGIAFNRIMRMSLHNGDHIKTWRFNIIKAWNINWETKHMMIQVWSRTQLSSVSPIHNRNQAKPHLLASIFLFFFAVQKKQEKRVCDYD